MYNLYSHLFTYPGGGTPLNKLYRYVPHHRVWFLCRFGLKTGMGFEGNMDIYV